MLIHGFLEESTVNGPKSRCVVWFQGCDLNCKNCWNPGTHAFDKSKSVNWYKFCKEKLAPLPDDLEGITFSGGDPLQHAHDLKNIIWWVRTHKPKWSVGMFTGYTLKELEAGKWKFFIDDDSVKMEGLFIPGSKEQWDYIASKIDFAIMGRYNQLAPADPTSSPMVSSTNQEIKLFSDRYTLEDFPQQGVEVFVDETGLIQITGFPINVDLEDFTHEKRERSVAGDTIPS
jgi:anaerobic ribonucleoside-triphosphate reductase activating protein